MSGFFFRLGPFDTLGDSFMRTYGCQTDSHPPFQSAFNIDPKSAYSIDPPGGWMEVILVVHRGGACGPHWGSRASGTAGVGLRAVLEAPALVAYQDLVDWRGGDPPADADRLPQERDSCPALAGCRPRRRRASSCRRQVRTPGCSASADRSAAAVCAAATQGQSLSIP